jgi:fatty acid/phospholipid biosynthesis enzyme
LNVSVKTIETHQMRMKEKLGVHSAAELRQKAREWLARSAVNRIREEPESEHVNGARLRRIGLTGWRDFFKLGVD